MSCGYLEIFATLRNKSYHGNIKYQVNNINLSIDISRHYNTKIPGSTNSPTTLLLRSFLVPRIVFSGGLTPPATVLFLCAQDFSSRLP